MEDTSKMGCNQSSDQNTRGVDQKPKTPQGAYATALDVNNEEIPCGVDLRVTKRHGGVRFTLSKKIQKTKRGVKFVQSPSVPPLTKDQPIILTTIDTLLQSALSKTNIEETKQKNLENPRQTILLDHPLPLKKRRRPRQRKQTNKNKTCVSQPKQQKVNEGVEALKETYSLPTNFVFPCVSQQKTQEVKEGVEPFTQSQSLPTNFVFPTGRKSV